MTEPTDAPSGRWPAALALWSTGIIALILGAVGLFDHLTHPTHTGRALILWGGSLGTVLCISAWFVRPRRAKEPQKLAAVALGLWPFVTFGGFILWQIGLSSEQRTACEAGDAEACYTLASKKARRDEPLVAAPLFERGCELGHGESCLALAMAREHGEADGDPVEAFALACEARVPRACGHLGAALDARDRFDEATQAWSDACALGDANGCAALELRASTEAPPR